MLKFLKVFLVLLMLVGIHHCQAEGSVEEGESEPPDMPPPDEEAEYEMEEGSAEDESMLQDSHGLTEAQMQELHKAIDGNKDGKITIEEAKAFVHKQQVDTGVKYSSEQVKDIPAATSGKYTSKEILQIYGDALGPDGEVRSEEDLAPEEELHHITFKVADKNSDGVLDEKELPRYFYPENYDDVLTATAGHQLKNLDTNGDSKLSLSELASSEDPEVLEDMRNEFKELDKDGNGFLTVDEFKSYHSGSHWTDKELVSFFETADSNGDKHINASELKDQHAALQDPSFYFLRQWSENQEL